MINSSEFESLIMLLEDTDESVSMVVQDKLRECGTEIIPSLEKVWRTTECDRTIKIIEKLIHEIRIDSLAIDIANWKNSDTPDLLIGMSILNRLLYPNVEYNSLKSRIDAICKPIWIELNDNLTALEKIRIVNHFLFNVNKFSFGNEQATQQFFLSTLLNTSKANVNVLTILYAIVAQQLKLPVQCVAPPNMLTLCYVDEFCCEFDSSNVLFYIDASSSGMVYDGAEITDYLRNSNIDHSIEYFQPCGNVNVMIYLISSLANCLKKLGDPRYNDCITLIKILK